MQSHYYLPTLPPLHPNRTRQPNPTFYHETCPISLAPSGFTQSRALRPRQQHPTQHGRAAVLRLRQPPQPLAAPLAAVIGPAPAAISAAFRLSAAALAATRADATGFIQWLGRLTRLPEAGGLGWRCTIDD